MSAVNPVGRLNEDYAILFTHIGQPKDYASLGQTCKQLHVLSRSFPVIASCSLPDRRYLLRYSLLSNPELVGAAFEVIRIKNAYFLGDTGGRPISTRKAEERFYLVFRKLCRQLNVNEIDEEFLNCALDVEGLYKYFTISMKQKIYWNMIDAFCDQPIQEISTHSLCLKIKELRLLWRRKTFVEEDCIHIETDVRRSLKYNKGNGFFGHAKNLQDLCSKKMLSGIETYLKNRLEIDKKKMQRELQILDGPRGCNGSVKESDYLRKYAWNARNIAYSKLVEVTGEMYFCKNFKPSSLESQAAFNKLIIRNKKFCAARDHYFRLVSKQEMLASRNEKGQMIGGELYLIEKKLKNIHETTADTMDRLIRFYFELDRDVTNSNKKDRHVALWRIMGMQPAFLLFSP